MPPHPSYRIDEESCAPVRLITGRRENLGLRHLFTRAHLIEDLALPIPPAASALLRMLVSIAARITGLDDPDMSTGDWHARRRALLDTPGGFPEDAVHAYFDQYVWDLFDPVRPWWQDPALARQCRKRAGVNALVFGRPAGNNLAWFGPHRDTAPQPVPSDQAWWHLLLHHSYGAAGRCSTRTIGARSSGKATAGPLRGTISFHPHGRNLYETLLAGVPPFTGDSQDTPDACPWEQATPPDPLQPPPPVTWPGRLLTGRSRHALLLVPAPDGRTVTDAYLTWATQHSRLEAIDPYLITDTDPQAPVERRRSPRKADRDRAVWRDLDPLLLAGDEAATSTRPAVFDTLNDLPPDVRAALRVRVHGFDQECRTRNRAWYTALTPPVWTWCQEHDPDRARRIAECRATAEYLAARLTQAATQAWRETTTPQHGAHTRHRAPARTPSWAARSRALFWPQAETTFWRLVNDDPQAPARPAFAENAVHALRTATRPALVQHQHAAAAVSRAIAALRAEPVRPKRHRSHR